MPKPKIYALYKGENFITEGTIREIAKETGLKENTLHFLRSPACRRRIKGNNGKMLINIEEE